MTLVSDLAKKRVNNMVGSCTQTTDGAKMASLEYSVLEEKGGLCLAEAGVELFLRRGGAGWRDAIQKGDKSNHGQ